MKPINDNMIPLLFILFCIQSLGSQDWESSADGGENREMQWQIDYTRKK